MQGVRTHHPPILRCGMKLGAILPGMGSLVAFRPVGLKNLSLFPSEESKMTSARGQGRGDRLILLEPTALGRNFGDMLRGQPCRSW